MKKGLPRVLLMMPLLTGCAAMQQQTAIDRHAVNPTDFTTKAAAARSKQIATAEIAIQRGQAPSVRNYAKNVLADAQADDPALDALAARYKVSVPAPLGPVARGDLETLQSLPRERFDQAYADQAAKDEQANLTFYTLASDWSHSPNVVRYASAEAPVLRRHFENANQVYSEVRTDFYAFFFSK
jgi:predicted outer membrane protein